MLHNSLEEYLRDFYTFFCLYWSGIEEIIKDVLLVRSYGFVRYIKHFKCHVIFKQGKYSVLISIRNLV